MLELRYIYFAAIGPGLSGADEQRYAYDDIMTHIHIGLGDQHRIIGTLNSGA
ncbi:MAG: hypothetical protein ACTXOO_01430 [Sodalis sp. (in: enterobacteria)]